MCQPYYTLVLGSFWASHLMGQALADSEGKDQGGEGTSGKVRWETGGRSGSASPSETVSAFLLSHFSWVWLFGTPWTVACQAPLSMGFSRQEYWNGLPFPPRGDLPNSETELGSPASQADSLPSEPSNIKLKIRKNIDLIMSHTNTQSESLHPTHISPLPFNPTQTPDWNPSRTFQCPQSSKAQLSTQPVRLCSFWSQVPLSPPHSLCPHLWTCRQTLLLKTSAGTVPFTWKALLYLHFFKYTFFEKLLGYTGS